MCTGDGTLVPAGLRGYRMWNLFGCDLGATNYDHSGWEDGLITAECHAWGIRLFGVDAAFKHQAPDANCGCGIYGWYRPDEARLHRGQVFGVIEASGRVLLGDFGFRAQQARVVALVASENTPPGFTEHWAARGVRVFSTREQLVAMFPPEDVTDLLGHPIPDSPPVDDAGWYLTNASITFTVDTSAFVKALQQVGYSMSTTAAAFSKTLKQLDAAQRRMDTPPPLPDDPKARALALRKQGTRGPEKRRRGRARLEL